LPVQTSHGTTTGYRKGCRCDACREAKAAAAAVYRLANHDRELARWRRYRDEHCEEVRARQRSQPRDPERERAKQRRYRAAHRDELNARDRAYRARKRAEAEAAA
jgi:hypothetical protein